MRYSSLSEKGRRPNNEDVVFTRFDLFVYINENELRAELLYCDSESCC